MQAGYDENIIAIYIHHAYNPTTTDNDIAVLKTKEDIEMGRFSEPIPLNTELFSGEIRATVYGWGVTESGYTSTYLRFVEVRTMTLQTCQRYYGSDITTKHICAGWPQGGRDSCQGDSGGPLIDPEANTLIGIVSWGGERCGDARKPGVYTNVAAYINWVLAVVSNQIAPNFNI